ncbi:Peptidoglycan-binding domain 1 protein [Neorhizobium galegae bv. officinalis]|nr:Peptidoglycan-binding domain 1 protein [Neorhizobium galegae bv. officinalis]
MGVINAQQIRTAAKGPVNASNLNSVLIALDRFGSTVGLDLPHRVVAFLAQLMHESGDFKFDGELWGPTPAQKRYDTRTDLGNTPAADGDGYKNRGRGPIQLTGAANIKAFYAWCVKKGFSPPDFISNPDLINSDPWEGLSAIWYWEIGNPDRKSLNRYADQGNHEMLTRRINGGLNGYADRLDRYTRLGLVVLGFGPTDLLAFQKAATAAGKYDGDLDGDDGPKTRAAIHLMLAARAPKAAAMLTIKPAPVTEEKAVAVTPPSMDAPWWKSKEVIVPAVTGGGLTSGLAAVGSVPWENLAVILLALGLAGAFLLWRKDRDNKAVAARVGGLG